MTTLFRTGDGETEDTIIVALELVNLDWFKRALVGAISLMCNQENWTEVGTATADFARDKSNEMLESLVIDVIIPPQMAVGLTMGWHTATPPDGWLICDGQAVSRATYADLFALWGTTYGAGNGTTTFNLLDMKNKSPMGAGSTVAVNDDAGSFVHAITSAQMPVHSHGQQVSGVAAYQSVGGSGRIGYGSLATNSLTRVVTDTAGSGANMPLLHPVKGVHTVVWTGVI